MGQLQVLYKSLLLLKPHHKVYYLALYLLNPLCIFQELYFYHDTCMLLVALVLLLLLVLVESNLHQNFSILHQDFDHPLFFLKQHLQQMVQHFCSYLQKFYLLFFLNLLVLLVLEVQIKLIQNLLFACCALCANCSASILFISPT